ncbi:hypothetical protein EV421DRAFT_1733778 [Armillaria borealis]|uniref:Uncharacterized protein n=1 Tax=Armillaria borealis TaxID=47425 RepID=A0AA39MU51_9AGAR|nr:hypothetical protein EV421DRAFT_1733778 [Armillaria borealis]
MTLTFANRTLPVLFPAISLLVGSRQSVVAAKTGQITSGSGGTSLSSFFVEHHQVQVPRLFRFVEQCLFSAWKRQTWSVWPRQRHPIRLFPPTFPQSNVPRKARATRKPRTKPKGFPLMLWGWPLDENFFVPDSQNHLDCRDDIGEIYRRIHPILREHRLIYRLPIKAINIKSKPNLVLYFATNQSPSRMKKTVKTEEVERFMEAAAVFDEKTGHKRCATGFEPSQASNPVARAGPLVFPIQLVVRRAKAGRPIQLKSGWVLYHTISIAHHRTDLDFRSNAVVVVLLSYVHWQQQTKFLKHSHVLSGPEDGIGKTDVLLPIHLDNPIGPLDPSESSFL